MLTAERLRALLWYDPESGKFTWLVNRRGGVRAGEPAGTVDPRGYRHIRIDQRSYQAHRLAWLYMTGEWPVNNVDHINGTGDDNSWGNLREATNAENLWNSRRQRNNKSGVKGVSWYASKRKWRAFIYVNGKQIFLGLFEDITAASAAYADASRQYHGEFGRLA